jgi:hypothetical protein
VSEEIVIDPDLRVNTNDVVKVVREAHKVPDDFHDKFLTAFAASILERKDAALLREELKIEMYDLCPALIGKEDIHYNIGLRQLEVWAAEKFNDQDKD